MLSPHPAAPNFMLNSILSLAPESPLEHAVLRNQRRRSMADLSSSVFARLRECVCLAAAMECECVCSCGSGVSGIRTTREGLVVRYAIANDETGQRPWQGGHMQPRQAGDKGGPGPKCTLVLVVIKWGRPSPSNFSCSLTGVSESAFGCSCGLWEGCEGRGAQVTYEASFQCS
jgi:hypothetical protein